VAYTDAPSQPQLDWIASLLEKKDLERHPTVFDATNAMDAGEHAAFMKAITNPVNRRDASQLIDLLKASPWKKAKVTAAPLPEVPAGRYYVREATMGVDGFIQVDKPTTGKWAGYTFVKDITDGTSWDAQRKIKGREAAAILAEIAKDPARAAQEYGFRTGHCGKCHTKLDVNLSRHMGAGPVCAVHYGIDPAPYRDELRAAGIDPTGSNDDLSVLHAVAA
jgi:hypothetical protein